MNGSSEKQRGGEAILPDETGQARAPCAASPGIVRRRLAVRGRVQGVGFRPYVFRLARDVGVGGRVGNDPRGVFIEVEGAAAAVETFAARLQAELPPLAKIASVSEEDLPPQGQREFAIAESTATGEQNAEITPDTATCDDCLAELLDPNDRRFRYPFINCTHCGPRYSILRAVPYDRPNTTMSAFTMCPACRAEYDDPVDRRFHAQPNACGVCGPRVRLTDSGGREIPGDAIRLAARRLRDGEIVAVKGLGGFHLACRADDEAAVARLRERKAREAKPLAIMVADLEAARALAEVDALSAAALAGPVRPIVLTRKRRGAPIAESVAPGSDCFGLLLPYTPLHVLLLAEGPGALVMTSGNPTAEPLCRDNDEALARLGRIADAFLLHDRPIRRRVDDSVVKTMPVAAGAPLLVPLRRARGMAPAPIAVSDRGAGPILAVGGELKSTLCILDGGRAVVSEHLGELANPAAYRNFVESIDCFQRLLATAPRIVACDPHPDYAATRWARARGLPRVEVQHHHAHVVACMADNGISGSVVGISCDGTGYGADGAIWGCEVLVCDEADFRRAGHLRYFPLVGGDAAAQDTWRPAAGLLRETLGPRWLAAAKFVFDRADPEAIRPAERRLAGDEPRAAKTSSLGRVFDAAAFILGVCDRNRYEAEAPMKLEALASARPSGDPMDYEISEGPTMVMDPSPMVRGLLADARAARPVAESARAFHETVAAMLADCAARAADRDRLDRVVLSGGCFANRILLRRVTERLHAGGREVFVHARVPTGDGGISLGQAVAAAERTARGMPPCA